MQTEVIVNDSHAMLFDLAKIEHAEGLNLIGDGLYSNVYGSNDTPYAVKIMRGRDAGYLAYVRVINELELDNPYLPKIIRVIQYRRSDDGCDNVYVIYIERLRGDFMDRDRARKFGNKLQNICVNYRGGSRTAFNKLRPVHQELVVLLTIACEEGKRTAGDRIGFDMHCYNIMARGNHFVVTDPLS